MLRRPVAPRFVFALITCSLALGAMACRGGASRLEGRWRGVRAEGVPPESLAAANAYAMKTELDVKGSSMTITSPKETRTFEYSVVKDEKASLVIGTSKERASETETFTFENDKSMKWAVDPSHFIVFVHE